MSGATLLHGGVTMAKFKMAVIKYAYYEVTADTDDIAVVEELETAKLSSSADYGGQLNLTWEFDGGPQVQAINGRARWKT
jgi:hypothetical protein